MLADEMVQLLTGFVDGELSPRQRQAALRLLHQSSEARELLLQLQENAHKVKQLPRHPLDAGFTAEVLHAIAERNVQPSPPPRRPALALRWLPYAAAGVAAAVLFVATLGVTIYFALGGEEVPPLLPNPGGVAANGNGPDAANGKPAPKPPAPDPLPAPRKANPLIAQMVDGAYQFYAAPIPVERALSVTFQDLKKEGPAAKQLAAEVKKNPALEFDVTVRNNPRAIDRLKSVLRKHGIKLVVDPGSSAALKQEPRKTSVLVYAENLHPDEWTQILKELAAEEKKAINFDKVKVSPLAKHEHLQVASLLGTDPETRNQGTKNGMIQPNPKAKPAGKVERVAVLLPQAPAAKASEEVRQFLFQSADPPAGSVRVLLRIHQE